MKEFWAVLWLGLQNLTQQFLGLVGDNSLARELKLARNDSLNDLFFALSIKGQLVKEHLIHHHTNRPDVLLWCSSRVRVKQHLRR